MISEYKTRNGVVYIISEMEDSHILNAHEAIVVDWKTNPYLLMSEVNTKLDGFNLKVIQYETHNDSYCFVIVKK